MRKKHGASQNWVQTAYCWECGYALLPDASDVKYILTARGPILCYECRREKRWEEGKNRGKNNRD